MCVSHFVVFLQKFGILPVVNVIRFIFVCDRTDSSFVWCHFRLSLYWNSSENHRIYHAIPKNFQRQWSAKRVWAIICREFYCSICADFNPDCLSDLCLFVRCEIFPAIQKLHGIFLLNWLVPSNAFVFWICKRQKKKQADKEKRKKKHTKRGDKSSNCFCWNRFFAFVEMKLSFPIINCDSTLAVSALSFLDPMNDFDKRFSLVKRISSIEHAAKGCNCFAKHLNIGDYDGWYDSFGAIAWPQ